MLYIIAALPKAIFPFQMHLILTSVKMDSGWKPISWKITWNKKVVCINRGGNRKELYLNDVPYEKFSKHIGLLPAVMIAPDDIELITGKERIQAQIYWHCFKPVGSGLPAATDHLYQGFAATKQPVEKMDGNKAGSMVVLEILDEQLLVPGIDIHIKRAAFLKELIPLVQQFYHMIADQAETIALEYSSQLNEESFAELLKLYRQKKICYCSAAMAFIKMTSYLNWMASHLKTLLRKGSEKACCFLHLSWPNLNYWKKNKGFAPILLLDDVFEKLDSIRMQQLLKWVCRKNNGQVFITDTHRERLEEAFDSLDVEFQIIEL